MAVSLLIGDKLKCSLVRCVMLCILQTSELVRRSSPVVRQIVHLGDDTCFWIVMNWMTAVAIHNSFEYNIITTCKRTERTAPSTICCCHRASTGNKFEHKKYKRITLQEAMRSSFWSASESSKIALTRWLFSRRHRVWMTFTVIWMARWNARRLLWLERWLTMARTASTLRPIFVWSSQTVMKFASQNATTSFWWCFCFYTMFPPLCLICQNLRQHLWRSQSSFWNSSMRSTLVNSFSHS